MSFFRSSATRAQAALLHHHPRTILRRAFGSGAQQPESQSMQAKLFAGSKTREAWEPVMFATYVAAAVILVFGVGNKPDTDIKSWAQGEARARNRLQLQQQQKSGGEVMKFEFGVHYDTDEKMFHFDDKENPWDPFKQEDDDEDDEEEEEDDDE